MTSGGEEKAEAVKKDDNVAFLEQHADATANSAAKVSFLTSEDEEARIRMALDRGVFIGFTKEELLKFERDPGWKRLRLILLICFWLAWALLLLAAVIVIVLTPRCPDRPTLQWPEKFPIYEIQVPSFRVGRQCSGSTKNDNGNVDGILDVMTAGDDNYFDYIKPANIFWLRGLYDYFDSEKPELDGLKALFEASKKKQRRILLELLPFKEGSPKTDKRDMSCGIFSGVSIKGGLVTAEFECISDENDVKKLIDYVHEYRDFANGFVLDYSQWLLNQTSSGPTGKTLLQQLADAVTYGPSGESGSGDNKKHLFMRFPILDRRFVKGRKEELIGQRKREENIAREAGIRVIIETVAMNAGDPEACSTLECLVDLVKTVQEFHIANETTTYRAFAIDDVDFKFRTAPGDLWKSTEALTAFQIAGLPGTPVIYYGSEIGMASETSASGHMMWTDRNNNTCYDNSYICFCNWLCEAENGKENRTCPAQVGDHHASVREQIRAQSDGPLKSVVQLLAARQDNDSLSWGTSSMVIDQPKSGAQKILVTVRQAQHFETFALFLSLGAKTVDDEAVPHLPDDMAEECYQTVFSYGGKPDAKKGKERFSQMILANEEVRLVRVFKTCGAAANRALAWTVLLAMLVSFINKARWM